MDDQAISQHMEKSVAEFLELLGVKAVIQIDIQLFEDRKYLDIKLNVEENGAELIGKFGATLDSLATVISMMVPRTEERYGVLLDINGYRDERSKYIIDMTNKAVSQVVSENQQVVLAPMRAWERRIVHTTIAQNNAELITESQGDEPNRQVVIKPRQA